MLYHYPAIYTSHILVPFWKSNFKNTRKDKRDSLCNIFSSLKSISCLSLSIMGQGLLWNNLIALEPLWCKAFACIEYVMTSLMKVWHISSMHKCTASASLWQSLRPESHLKMKTSWALQLSFLLEKKLNISEAMIQYMLLWGNFITKARGWLLHFVWHFLSTSTGQWASPGLRRHREVKVTYGY